MGGGSLSLSTSPHRRSLEALGLLHNPGGRLSSLRVGDVDVYVDFIDRIGKKISCPAHRPTSIEGPLFQIFVRSRFVCLYCKIVDIIVPPLTKTGPVGFTCKHSGRSQFSQEDVFRSVGNILGTFFILERGFLQKRWCIAWLA